MNTGHTLQTLIAFEEKVKQAFIDKKINGPIHLSGGNEEKLIEIFQDVKEEDWVFSTHRSHYHYLLKGGAEDVLMMQIVKGRSMHVYDRNLNFFTSAIVGGGLPIAVGTALAIKRKHGKQHVWTFLGDGATDSGRYFESLRYAASLQLPITFVIENNGMSCDTPVDGRWTDKDASLYDMVHYTLIYDYERTYPHTGCGEFVTF